MGRCGTSCKPQALSRVPGGRETASSSAVQRRPPSRPPQTGRTNTTALPQNRRTPPRAPQSLRGRQPSERECVQSPHTDRGARRTFFERQIDAVLRKVALLLLHAVPQLDWLVEGRHQRRRARPAAELHAQSPDVNHRHESSTAGTPTRLQTIGDADEQLENLLVFALRAQAAHHRLLIDKQRHLRSRERATRWGGRKGGVRQTGFACGACV
jgi:hypothetical protein